MVNIVTTSHCNIFNKDTTIIRVSLNYCKILQLIQLYLFFILTPMLMLVVSKNILLQYETVSYILRPGLALCF